MSHLVWFMWSDNIWTLLVFPAGYQNHTQITTFNENSLYAYLMLNKSLVSSVKPSCKRFSVAVNTVNCVYIKNHLSQKFDDSEGRLLRFVGEELLMTAPKLSTFSDACSNNNLASRETKHNGWKSFELIIAL